jgi:hypothetical protein
MERDEGGSVGCKPERDLKINWLFDRAVGGNAVAHRRIATPSPPDRPIAGRQPTVARPG